MKVASAFRPTENESLRRFRVWTTGLLMRTVTLLLLLAAGASQAQAAGKTKGARRAPATRSAPAAEPRPDVRATETRSTDESEAAPDPKPEPKPEPRASSRSPKAKVYTFSGLDVEGKLKTPQLLYFLNRVKMELDTTGREKRSFLKELEQSSDDKGL
jgi:hypothetical protein